MEYKGSRGSGHSKGYDLDKLMQGPATIQYDSKDKLGTDGASASLYGMKPTGYSGNSNPAENDLGRAAYNADGLTRKGGSNAGNLYIR